MCLRGGEGRSATSIAQSHIEFPLLSSPPPPLPSMLTPPLRSAPNLPNPYHSTPPPPPVGQISVPSVTIAGEVTLPAVLDAPKRLSHYSALAPTSSCCHTVIPLPSPPVPLRLYHVCPSPNRRRRGGRSSRCLPQPIIRHICHLPGNPDSHTDPQGANTFPPSSPPQDAPTPPIS